MLWLDLQTNLGMYLSLKTETGNLYDILEPFLIPESLNNDINMRNFDV